MRFLDMQPRINEEEARITLKGTGQGEIGDDAIEQRAVELARADGRAAVGEQDRWRAREEILHPGPPPAPEGDMVEKWSTAAAARAHRGAQAPLDDEESVPERLVHEGVEEADHDRRVAASGENIE